MADFKFQTMVIKMVVARYISLRYFYANLRVIPLAPI
jgi:hypothetical protein